MLRYNVGRKSRRLINVDVSCRVENLIRDAGALGVMCSYNAVNGLPPSSLNRTTANLELQGLHPSIPIRANVFLVGILKVSIIFQQGQQMALTQPRLAGGTWCSNMVFKRENFIIFTFSITSQEYHSHCSSCYKEITRKATLECKRSKPRFISNTGTDIAQENPSQISCKWSGIGEISDELARAALKNAFRMRFRMGLFDPQSDNAFRKISLDEVGKSQDLSLSAAKQSMVLLKNQDNLLPLKTNQKIAVIGQNVNDTMSMTGNYDGPLCPDSSNRLFSIFDAIFKIIRMLKCLKTYRISMVHVMLRNAAMPWYS